MLYTILCHACVRLPMPVLSVEEKRAVPHTCMLCNKTRGCQVSMPQFRVSRSQAQPVPVGTYLGGALSAFDEPMKDPCMSVSHIHYIVQVLLFLFHLFGRSRRSLLHSPARDDFCYPLSWGLSHRKGRTSRYTQRIKPITFFFLSLPSSIFPAPGY